VIESVTKRVDGVTQQVATQGKAISQLQEVAVQIADGLGSGQTLLGKPSGSGQPSGNGDGELAKLNQFLSMLPKKDKSDLNLESLAKLADTKKALDSLFPPSPYEVLATSVGIKAMEAFASKLGIEAAHLT